MALSRRLDSRLCGNLLGTLQSCSPNVGSPCGASASLGGRRASARMFPRHGEGPTMRTTLNTTPSPAQRERGQGGEGCALY